jgi:hypothetical protein
MIESTVVKPFIPWLLALATLALAQQTSSKKEAPPPQQKQESKSLFQNKLGYRSSKTSAKDSTTLGFNGIDPAGKVDEQMLATSPGAADHEQVKKMDEARPSETELKAFLSQGGLNAK